MTRWAMLIESSYAASTWAVVLNSTPRGFGRWPKAALLFPTGLPQLPLALGLDAPPEIFHFLAPINAVLWGEMVGWGLRRFVDRPTPLGRVDIEIGVFPWNWHRGCLREPIKEAPAIRERREDSPEHVDFNWLAVVTVSRVYVHTP